MKCKQTMILKKDKRQQKWAHKKQQKKTKKNITISNTYRINMRDNIKE